MKMNTIKSKIHDDNWLCQDQFHTIQIKDLFYYFFSNSNEMFVLKS